ncbi:MAG: lysophospholipase [Clostridia bacterium]|nr:lysophospholipase [Clostridia bacterium]
MCTKAEKINRYRELNKTAEKHGILFAGSSLMEKFPVEKYAAEQGITVCNRGIGGFVTQELLDNLDACILDLAPRRLFINIGTNDLSIADMPISAVMDNYRLILQKVRAALPDVEIFMMAYYPINYEAAAEDMKPCLRVRTNEKIEAANREVEKLAKELGARYIDVNAPLKDSRGRLKAEYTIEGMHIREEGYRAIYPLLAPYLA